MEHERMIWVVQTYSPLLLRTAFLYLKNTADAEDTAQDVFLSYWERQPTFANEAARKAWLYKAVCNRCRDKLRSGWIRHRAQLTENCSLLLNDGERVKLTFSLVWSDQISDTEQWQAGVLERVIDPEQVCAFCVGDMEYPLGK